MKTLEEIKSMQVELKNTIGPRPADAKTTRVLFGMSTCGVASGTGAVMEAMKKAAEEQVEQEKKAAEEAANAEALRKAEEEAQKKKDAESERNEEEQVEENEEEHKEENENL